MKNREASFLESKYVGLGVDLLVELDDGTAWAAEHCAAVFHDGALETREYLGVGGLWLITSYSKNILFLLLGSAAGCSMIFNVI